MSKEKAEIFSRALDRAIADQKRQKRGYSAKKMADAVGMPYYTLANLRRGNTAITQDIILAISGELPTFEKHYKEEEEHAPPEVGRDSNPQKTIEQILKEVREIKENLVRENQELMRKYVKELEKNIELLKKL